MSKGGEKCGRGRWKNLVAGRMIFKE